MSIFAMQADAAKVKVQHVHPLCWWAGMKNPELQILIHGEGVGTQQVALKDAQGIEIKEVVTQENPNYLILYLDTKNAPAQKFTIKVGRQSIPYELKARESVNRKTYDASDVLYLLMPDRFANGNPKNDVVKGMLEQTCDVNVPMARHGGDIAGMEQHLDYLAELGITAIWPTPTLVNDMPKESYHGYAITNYYETDPRFGTNDEYRHFVQEAHKKGIKIVMDIVFNHCGRQNFLYQDMPQKDWFNFDGKYVQSSYRTGAYGDVHASQFDRTRTIDGWFVEAMPDMNQKNRLVIDYLIQASMWWIEWAGIDGFRQDTYPYNDFDGMRKWCDRIELEYPGFNIVGEVWVNNNVGVAYWQKDSK
ncbi:MAG: cyclomaltodextrinase N-terminal domain-containing protein, partial [Bacteroidaceae bacterium]|nr:cyclomaltodextrinase N-terminal domain-containing protein [Bacteroidaceae bacterium]